MVLLYLHVCNAGTVAISGPMSQKTKLLDNSFKWKAAQKVASCLCLTSMQ